MAEQVGFTHLSARPWKNGGGSTTELAAFPQDSSFDGFQWRLSVAEVGSDGPFSIFGGVDRTLALLQGSGMRLFPMNQAEVLITPERPAYQFTGEVAITAVLLEGPTKDFNVMTRRSTCRHLFRIEAVNGEIAVRKAANWTILFVAKGEIGATGSEGQGWNLCLYDTLIMKTLETVRVHGEEAIIFVIDIFPCD